MADAVAEDWIASLLALKGRQGTFLLGDSILKAPRGTALGTPVVSGAGQTGDTLITSGWPVASNGLLKKGDWIQLGSGLLPWTGVTDWLTDIEIAEKTATDITIHFSSPAPVGDGELNWGMGSLFDFETIPEGNNSVVITHNLGLGGVKRLYKTVTEVNSDAAGLASVEIFPRLRESPASGEPLILTNCVGTFRLKENKMPWSVDTARMFGIEIEALEAV